MAITNIMKAEETKKKIISKAILNMITPYLYDLVNDYRIVRRA